MPRTFSRGKKVSAEFLSDMQQYLSLAQAELWINQMRFLYCPEQGLIETDITPFFRLFFPERLTRIDRLADGLQGGGIIPGSIKRVTLEMRQENFRILSKFDAIPTPGIPGR